MNWEIVIGYSRKEAKDEATPMGLQERYLVKGRNFPAVLDLIDHMVTEGDYVVEYVDINKLDEPTE